MNVQTKFISPSTPSSSTVSKPEALLRACARLNKLDDEAGLENRAYDSHSIKVDASRIYVLIPAKGYEAALRKHEMFREFESEHGVEFHPDSYLVSIKRELVRNQEKNEKDLKEDAELLEAMQSIRKEIAGYEVQYRHNAEEAVIETLDSIKSILAEIEPELCPPADTSN